MHQNPSAVPSPPTTDIDLVGEILNTSPDVNTLPDDDPILHSLQQAQDIINQSWSPSLNSVQEENYFDIKIANSEPVIKHPSHVSSKHLRGRLHQRDKLQ